MPPTVTAEPVTASAHGLPDETDYHALNAMLNLPADATRAQLLDAMKDIVVGKAAYVGRFHQ